MVYTLKRDSKSDHLQGPQRNQKSNSNIFKDFFNMKLKHFRAFLAGSSNLFKDLPMSNLSISNRCMEICIAIHLSNKFDFTFLAFSAPTSILQLVLHDSNGKPKLIQLNFIRSFISSHNEINIFQQNQNNYIFNFHNTYILTFLYLLTY